MLDSARYVRSVIYEHKIALFVEGRKIFSVSDTHESRNYDDFAAMLGKFPIMDLYDLATEGVRRRARIRHMCGLSGFGESGDRCPACENESGLTEVSQTLPY